MIRELLTKAAVPFAFFAIAVAITLAIKTFAEETWNGLVVAPENRCSPYNAKDYHYTPAVEKKIVAAQDGRIYGPYTKRDFDSIRKTDIEHIVARSEAHDSGMCAYDDWVKRDFATDLDNLTLAAPNVNRCNPREATRGVGKCDKDAAEWLPFENECWYVNRIVEVKRKYALTIDSAERDALEAVLESCESTEMEME